MRLFPTIFQGQEYKWKWKNRFLVVHFLSEWLTTNIILNTEEGKDEVYKDKSNLHETTINSKEAVVTINNYHSIKLIMRRRKSTHIIKLQSKQSRSSQVIHDLE